MATSPALNANINGSVVLSKMQDLSIPGPKHEATSQHLWSQAVSTVALISIALACCPVGRCESCVDSVFNRPSASCPECGIALRRNQYRPQQFTDPYVEKEVEIRKRILKE